MSSAKSKNSEFPEIDTIQNYTWEQLQELNSKVESEIQKVETELIHAGVSVPIKKPPPQNSRGIQADVTHFEWADFVQQETQENGEIFDVIVMDPPWKIGQSNPTQGIRLNYETLNDSAIAKLPIQSLQKNGLIFIWTINNKFKFTLQLLEQWGYKMIEDIVWVKTTKNNKLFKGQGYFLQHSKESCIVGLKGKIQKPLHLQQHTNVIMSPKRGKHDKRKVPNIYARL